MINFGFDNIISYDENNNMVIPYPNMYNKELYNIDLTYYNNFPTLDSNINRNDALILNKLSICFNLNDDLYSFTKNTVDYYIQNNQEFVYSLLIWNNKLFDDKIHLEIPIKVKEQLKLNKCKLVIFYITEPWFMYEHCYTWLSELSSKNGLNKDNFIFVSSNLIAPEIKKQYINEGKIIDNFTIIEFNYFFHRLWFFNERFHEENSKKIYTDVLSKNLDNLRNIPKEKHFLCFNRKPHDHRVAIYAEVMTNSKLKDKTIITLGKENIIHGQTYKQAIRRFIDTNYKHGNERLYNFIDNLDPNVDYLFDTESMEPEQSININLDIHNRTFCNVVTETITSENLIFFSEKIIKSIFALQPFILIGNRNSLKKLKEYGFKTFDKWWDESYDEKKYQTRFESIVDLLEEISTWDNEKIKITLSEMEETLIYNFNMLLEDKSTKQFFDKFLNKKIT